MLSLDLYTNKQHSGRHMHIFCLDLLVLIYLYASGCFPIRIYQSSFPNESSNRKIVRDVLMKANKL